MDISTGEIYGSKEHALKAGASADNIVELIGSKEAVITVSGAVKDARRRKNKAARKSRKKNR